MKPSIKFSLLGGIVGAVMMFIAVVIIEWQLDKHPALDTQVLDYLSSQDYPIDTLENNQYVFLAYEDRIVFDYFPDDEEFLRFFANYDVSNSSYEEVAAAAIKITNTKKNCTVVPKQMEDGGLIIQISVESFIDEDDELNTSIIDRALCALQGARYSMILQLGHL